MSRDETRPELLARLPLETLRKAMKENSAQGHDPAKLRLANDCLRAIELKGVRQNPEMEHCGQIFPHHHPPSPENGWRGTTTFTGDPMAWMQPFTSPGMSGKIDRDAGVERYETRKVLKSHGYIG